MLNVSYWRSSQPGGTTQKNIPGWPKELVKYTSGRSKETAFSKKKLSEWIRTK
jgi:hypothetical protein